jgi:tRNA(Ile)-lysidine synthase
MESRYGPFLPSSDLVARFRADLERLAGTPARLGVAVSGGPDSLALLLLAVAAYPGRVAAATVDHGLRPESGWEALHVEDICARLDCPHQVLSVAVAAGGAGLQAAGGTRDTRRCKAGRRPAASRCSPPGTMPTIRRKPC